MSAFAFKLPVPNATAVVEYNGIWWPQLRIEGARKNAKRCGLPGFWRLKSLKVIPECLS